MVLRTVFQYQLAEDYCLGNSKTRHSKEQFSERPYCKKNIYTYEWFSKPFIYSKIRLQMRCSQNRGPVVVLEHAGTPTIMTIHLPLGDLEHEQWFTTCVFGETNIIRAYIEYVWRNVWRILLSSFVRRGLRIKSLKNTLKFSKGII
jgi:hypothetical protein